MSATSLRFPILCALALAAGCGGSPQAGGTTTPDPVAAETPADAAPAADPPPTDPPPGGGEVTPPADGMKLQVLPASWTQEQVSTYMKTVVSPGLGVKCVHCHDVNDFAADSDNKTKAREMMKMVDDINAKHFKGEPRVTCTTCHNGKAEPPKVE